MSNGGVVITGSAGGVGWAYAGEFMDRGYDVVICDVKDCTAAAAALTQKHPAGNVYHTTCDVSDSASVENLASFAKENLGTVNYWINNAGVNGGRRDLRDVPISQVELVVKVSLQHARRESLYNGCDRYAVVVSESWKRTYQTKINPPLFNNCENLPQSFYSTKN